MFLLLNIIFRLFKKWKKKEGFKKVFYNFIDRYRMWWNLLILMIDGNLLFTTFSGFIQLLMPASLNFQNKINIAITIFYIFINLIFPFVLYPFIYNSVPKEKG